MKKLAALALVLGALGPSELGWAMDAERWTRRFLLAGLLWVAVGLGVLGWVASAHARLPGFQTCLEEKAFYEKTGYAEATTAKYYEECLAEEAKNAAEEAREHEERGAEEEARAAKEAKREARKAAREARLTREAHMRRPTVHRRQAELGVKRLLRREVWTWPGAYSTLACRRQFRPAGAAMRPGIGAFVGVTTAVARPRF